MAREEHHFGTRDDITGYLVSATGSSPEQAAETVDIVMQDGVVLLDNSHEGSIFAAKTWEITYDDGVFHVVHESGYLTADGRII
jgi:hypothetical protein